MARADGQQAAKVEAGRRAYLERWRVENRVDDPTAPPPVGFERCPRTRRLVAVGVRINGRWRTSVSTELQE